MIREVSVNDLDIIKDIESKFPYIYNDGSIIYDFQNNPYSKIIVYLQDNKVIGFINYYDIIDRLEIANFNVLDYFQNKGIGSKLMNYLIKKYQDKYFNITLEVRKDNEKAIHLYKKLGFIEKSIRKNYYNDVDGVLMEKELMRMKDVYILGVESSCDDTSFSIVKNGEVEISTSISSQIDIHKKYGGVVPEIASRSHIKNITFVLEECLNKANMKMEDIDAIAVTYGPGLIGSLLVGLETAKTLSWLYHKPLVPIHHIKGHIYANNLAKRLSFPLIALVVSGGHTELVLMDKEYSFKVLGSTLDDAVGECYDKVGRILDIDYPAGPVLDELAHKGKHSYNLPTPLNDDSYNFSFSGLKSAVINLVHNEKQRNMTINKEDLATSFQDVVCDVLVKKTMKALKDYNIHNLVLAGGVSANRGLRELFKEKCDKENINLTYPDIRHCTDNASMIAACGYYAYKLGYRADLNLNAKSSEDL